VWPPLLTTAVLPSACGVTTLPSLLTVTPAGVLVGAVVG
jgi:hypothetical protein